MALVLAACSTVGDVFGGDDSDNPPPAATKSTGEAAKEKGYPNLSTVPERPQRPNPPEGLAPDRANARYSNSDIKPVNEAAGAVVAPRPPSPSAPAAPAAAPAAPPSTPAPAAAPSAPPPSGPAAPVGKVQSSSLPAAQQTAAAPAAAPAQAAPAAPAGPTAMPAPVPPSSQQLVLPSPFQGSRASATTPSRTIPTPGPAAASASGGRLEIAVIQFGRASAGIDGTSLGVLRDVASIQRSQGGVVRIVGHASDDVRNPGAANAQEANYEISLARANAVANQLVRLGVPRNMIVVEAASDDQPQYDPSNSAAVSANRRAEIYLDF